MNTSRIARPVAMLTLSSYMHRLSEHCQGRVRAIRSVARFLVTRELGRVCKRQ